MVKPSPKASRDGQLHGNRSHLMSAPHGVPDRSVLIGIHTLLPDETDSKMASRLLQTDVRRDASARGSEYYGWPLKLSKNREASFERIPISKTSTLSRPGSLCRGSHPVFWTQWQDKKYCTVQIESGPSLSQRCILSNPMALAAGTLWKARSQHHDSFVCDDALIGFPTCRLLSKN